MEVSGIETFSVIDAPLAWLDLKPRRAALRQARQRNGQLVLAMSDEEIHGCEDLLDPCVDRRYTLTLYDDYCRIGIVL